MPSTFKYITKNTLGSNQSTITLSSIPGIHTDLLLKLSLRCSGTGFYTDNVRFTFNGGSSTQSSLYLFNENNVAKSGSDASNLYSWYPAQSVTTNAFSNIDLYIPNYTSSSSKTVSIDMVYGNNDTTNIWEAFTAGLWNGTSAITSITLTAGSVSFLAGSSVFLYGITSS